MTDAEKQLLVTISKNTTMTAEYMKRIAEALERAYPREGTKRTQPQAGLLQHDQK